MSEAAMTPDPMDLACRWQAKQRGLIWDAMTDNDQVHWRATMRTLYAAIEAAGLRFGLLTVTHVG